MQLSPHPIKRRGRIAFTVASVVLGSLLTVTSRSRSEKPASFEKIATRYKSQIQPLLTTYCVQCHGSKEPEADVDLEAQETLADVRREPRVWQKVLFVLDNAEMPPKHSKQLAPREKRALIEWVRTYLNAEAHANAGDPGRVIVRRLSNSEYDNTIRDLTGVDLQLTREFPADSSAGEGFTNAGESMVMSPALFEKYLAAANDVAQHAVLLPDGFRFSRRTARRDQTDEVIDRILAMYAEKTESVELRMTGGNRDGRIRWGQVALGPYMRTLIQHRESLAAPGRVAEVAKANGLNDVYLGHLSRIAFDDQPTALLAEFQRLLRETTAADTPTLERETASIVEWITEWQRQLMTLEDIGQLFKPGQQPLNPIQIHQEFRLELTPSADAPRIEKTAGRRLFLAANSQDDLSQVVWKNARFEHATFGTVRLRDVDPIMGHVETSRKRTLTRTRDYLNALAQAATSDEATVKDLARAYGIDADVLGRWANLLNIPFGDSAHAARITGLLKAKVDNVANFASVKGWGTGPPNIIANSSDTVTAKVPADVPPRSVGVHPSPSHYVGIGWRSPIGGTIKIDGRVIGRHDCGNGVEWSIVAQRGLREERLASGVVEVLQSVTVPTIEDVRVRVGEVVSLRIGPRDRNHGCDQTQVEFVLTEQRGQSRKWDLVKDVALDIQAGNPHPDRLGNAKVWYFYTAEGAPAETVENPIPAGCVLVRWRRAVASGESEMAARLAQDAANLLMNGPVDGTSDADRRLFAQVRAIGATLFQQLDRDLLKKLGDADTGDLVEPEHRVGIDRESFRGVDLVTQAPSTLALSIPPELTSGWTFVVSGELAEGAPGFVQLDVTFDVRPQRKRLIPGPIIAREGSSVDNLLQAAFVDFRAHFPRALCCRTIVPIDKVITLVMYHREDEHFRQLLLTDAERRRLNRLWQEVRYISQDALKIQEYFPLFLEFSTQGNDTHVFLPLKEPIRQRAEAFAKHLEETESAQIDALVEFAGRAYRRKLDEREESTVRAMYATLRSQEEGHDAAIRGVLTRVLVSPRFLYRIEEPRAGKAPSAVTDTELATRLSYFLWASTPDDRLLGAAREGTLSDPRRLASEARRMLADERVRGLATEFACQWLGVRTFASHNDKNEKQYPTFVDVRGDLFEESVRFFEDLFRRDGSVLEIIDADHTFLNDRLAKHYGIRGVMGGWQRVDGMKGHSRGGVLGMGAILAKQSGATRTSPVLRGNWVVETLLGEKLPDPPATVPELPDTLSRDGLTVRQMTERHVSDPSCANCHNRIDPFGFALESFDAIGRFRNKDLLGKPVNTKVRLRDGTRFEGIDGLRAYLLLERRKDFLEQFCRKLLGFALGRTVELSDKPLVDEMVGRLTKNGFRFSAAPETILGSKQFRFHRGLEATHEE